MGRNTRIVQVDASDNDQDNDNNNSPIDGKFNPSMSLVRNLGSEIEENDKDVQEHTEKGEVVGESGKVSYDIGMGLEQQTEQSKGDQQSMREIG